jgi:sugar lactone lactonase YvrE
MKNMKSTSSVCIFLVLLILRNDIHVVSGNYPYHEIPLPNEVNMVIGPESIAFDCNGNGPYIGVSDGRVLKWQQSTANWSEFSIPSSNRNRSLCDGTSDTNMEGTCGRPLGLKFNLATCDLIIADAYFGLLKVGSSGGVAKSLATCVEGVPFKLTNAFDIDEQTGVIYFTDSSKIYQRREYYMSFISGDRTGSLLKYDPESKQVSVMYKGLAFPNGVALSKDKSFLLVAESETLKLLKFPLLGSKTQNPELFAQVRRNPDNIKRNRNGEFWVALNSGRGEIRRLSRTTTSAPKSDVVKIETTEPNWSTQDPVGIKFDKDGKVVQFLNGNDKEQLDSVSEVEEHNGSLYFGSTVKPYVGVLNL